MFNASIRNWNTWESPSRRPRSLSKAAIDLLGTLLMKLDHPGIVKIRAISAISGTEEPSREHTSFFFVMDPTPRYTLDGRIWEWRKVAKKNTSPVQLCLGGGKKEVETKSAHRCDLGGKRQGGSRTYALKRIINRDVKTANVGFNVHGDSPRFGQFRIVLADADKDDRVQTVLRRNEKLQHRSFKTKKRNYICLRMFTEYCALWGSCLARWQFRFKAETDGSSSRKKYGVSLPLCERLAHCSNLIQSGLPRTPWEDRACPRLNSSNRRCTTSEWKSLVERTRQSSFEYTLGVQADLEKRFDRVWNAERKKMGWRCRLAWSFRSVRWRWALRLLVAQRTKAALSWRPSQDNFEYISMVLSLRGSRGHCDTTAQFIYTNPMYTYLPSYPPRHVVVWTTVLNFEVPLPL
jgi:hypothetical protein